MADEPKPEEKVAAPAPSEPAPANALETPDPSTEDGVIDATSEGDKGKQGAVGGKPPKQPNAIKKFFKKVDVYLLSFILIAVFAAAFGMANYLNSKKAPAQAAIATQQLTQNALKALANSDATIGNAAQTLTVQGNAIFSGQVLVRSDLDVAGNIQLGGVLTAPQLTVTGNTTLNTTQASTLQVAGAATIQGTSNLKDLNVSGAASFSGPITASQITVTKLIIAGNGMLQVPNHISFPGQTPARTSITQSVLGAGGSASVGGSDSTGTVNVNTGNNPSTGCFVAITFAQPFTSTPHVIISPIGAGAGMFGYYATRTTTGFNICAATTPPTNQAFAFDYLVTG